MNWQKTWRLAPTLALAACTGSEPGVEWDDADGDGFLAEIDCDESDPEIHPGADEACDDVDWDCDGEPNEYCDTAGDTDPGDSDSGDTGGNSGPGPWDVDARLLGATDGDRTGLVVTFGGDADGDGLDELLIGTGSGTVYVVASTTDLSGDVALSDVGVAVTGEYPIRALDAGGDLTGDGYGDYLIGVPEGGGTGAEGSIAPGATYVLAGPVASNMSLDDNHARFIGEAQGDGAGMAVAGTGDFSGDGVADLLIGAGGNDSAEGQAGAAYLVLGPVEGEYNLNTADVKLYGERRSHQAGSSVARAGDANGDGIADLVVGAKTEALEAGYELGAAYLVLGPVTGWISLSAADAKRYGEADNDQAGTSVAGAGDIDGDGLDDFLCGAPYQDGTAFNTGAAYLLLGTTRGYESLETADAKVLGEVEGDLVGWSVSAAGDVDADGFDDFLVGGPALDESGKTVSGPGLGTAYIVYGPIDGTLSLADMGEGLRSEAAGARYGFSVAGSGDIDGDGWPDSLVGVPDSEAGEVQLFLSGSW